MKTTYWHFKIWLSLDFNLSKKYTEYDINVMLRNILSRFRPISKRFYVQIEMDQTRFFYEISDQISDVEVVYLQISCISYDKKIYGLDNNNLYTGIARAIHKLKFVNRIQFESVYEQDDFSQKQIYLSVFAPRYRKYIPFHPEIFYEDKELSSDDNNISTLEEFLN